MSAIRGPGHQRGVALVVGLIILVMMTLVVLSSVTLSTGNVKAVSNMQFRDAALAAANVAIEQVVSTVFVNTPAAVMVNVDMDQDGISDYVVDVPAPVCKSWHIKPSSQLDPDNPEDRVCFAGSRISGVGGASSASFCADTQWEVRAPVSDATTGAVVTVNQGVAVRMGVTLAGDACD